MKMQREAAREPLFRRRHHRRRHRAVGINFALPKPRLRVKRRRRHRTAPPRWAIPLAIGVGLALGWVTQSTSNLIAFLLVAGVIGGGVAYHYWLRWQWLRYSGIDEIDNMDGRTFERRLEVLFRDMGHQVQLTKETGDFGADLVVRRNGGVAVVQAKCFGPDRRVGIDAVQQVTGAVRYYNAREALVVTNREFTGAAVQLAASNNVVLWDRQVLVRLLGQQTRDQRRREQLGSD